MRHSGFVAAALLVLTAACGKKGPPLAPLNLVPDRPQEIVGRVVGDTTVLQFAVPTKNAGGQGQLALDHMEIYAVTVAAGAVTPPNRDVLTQPHVVGRIAIRPPRDPEAPEEEEPDTDTRPAPGTKITFTETLTAAQLTPEIQAQPAKTPAAKEGAGAGQTPPATEPVAPPAGVAAPAGGSTSSSVTPGLPGAEPPPVGQAAPQTTAPVPPPAVEKPADYPTRIYVLRGVTRKGRFGPPSARVVVPLVPPPPPAANVTANFSETAVTLAWQGAQATPGKAAIRYNVYAVEAKDGRAPSLSGTASAGAPTPLNAQPLETPAFEHAGATPGTERCFIIRSVEAIAGIALESVPSEPACVTPRDIFPPSAPKGLAAVSGTGSISLIWDPNPEADLAGYLVLRAEAPGDTLQPITPAPLRDARYTDTLVKPGVRYVYAVIAVDRAEPPNRSAQSNRVEETAR